MHLYTFPVAVEPVKDILATNGSVHRTSPTAAACCLEQGTTLYTPAGIPAWFASCNKAKKLQYQCILYEEQSSNVYCFKEIGLKSNEA